MKIKSSNITFKWKKAFQNAWFDSLFFEISDEIDGL